MPDAGGAAAPNMQLLAQDYGDILAALQAMIDTRGHERRTTARMDVQAQVKLFPYAEGRLGAAYTCLTRDLSFKGVGLFQSRASAGGSQLVVMLPRRNGEFLPLLCTVTYCRALADGLYNVGATFNGVYRFKSPPAVASSGASAGTGAASPLSGEDELRRIRQSILG